MNDKRLEESGGYQKASQEVALLKTQDSTAITRLGTNESNGRSGVSMLLIEIYTI